MLKCAAVIHLSTKLKTAQLPGPVKPESDCLLCQQAVGDLCRATRALRHLTFTSPNSAELVGMSDAARSAAGQSPLLSLTPQRPAG